MVTKARRAAMVNTNRARATNKVAAVAATSNVRKAVEVVATAAIAVATAGVVVGLVAGRVASEAVVARAVSSANRKGLPTSTSLM